MILLLIACTLLIESPQTAIVLAEQRPLDWVLPVVLDEASWQVGEEVWLEITYRAHPEGEVIHQEWGEKVWWVQNQPLLVLGATGLPLPTSILERATLWVEIRWKETEVSSVTLFPRKDCIRIQAGVLAFESLSKALPGLDASYLAQVAHFLAGNISALDVQGTSYSVSGFGPVIGANGHWVGGRLETLSPGYSVFVGQDAGMFDDGLDRKSTALGFQSLMNNSTGGQNAAVGHRALANNNTGNSNTAIGYMALENNNVGGANTALGDSALASNLAGENNVAIGANALLLNIDGDFNSGIGWRAMESNTTGSENTAVGSLSLFGNTSGIRNTASGRYALFSNSTGNDNIAFGYGALGANESGNSNTAVGYNALHGNTNGMLNTALGREALLFNQLGSWNTAAGYLALAHNSDGNNNVAVGHAALQGNRTGDENVAIGTSALLNNWDGVQNTALGFAALELNSSGYSNTAVGAFTLNSNITGHSNIALGLGALDGNTHGYYNIAIGNSCLNHNTTGERNIAIGHAADVVGVIGRYNTSIGSSSGSVFTNTTNSTAIGDYAKVSASNQIRLGDTLVNSIGGQVGWTTFSDGRYKTDVQDDIPGLAFINALRPVSFRVDIAALAAKYQNEKPLSEPHSSKQAGFIAQEVEKAASDLGFQFNGVDSPPNEQSFYGLRYGQFVVPLVSAVQEQQEEIESLETRIRNLETVFEELHALSSQ